MIELITILITIAGLFIWNRSESMNDWRHMDNKLEAIRNMIHEIHKETDKNIKAIHDEMKDFHNRLIQIEKDKKNGI